MFIYPSVFIHLVVEHLPSVLFFFWIVWLLMRKKDGHKLKIGSGPFTAGVFAAALGAGIVRFLSIFIIGGRATMQPGKGLGIFYFLVVPAIMAVLACSFLRRKAIAAKDIGDSHPAKME